MVGLNTGVSSIGLEFADTYHDRNQIKTGNCP
jgi:hypothetical protein